MYSSLYFQICSLFYIVLLMVIFFSKDKIKSKENKIFSILIVTNFVGLLLDLASTYMALTDLNNPLLNFISKLYLVYLLTWISLFTFYTFVISYSKNNSTEFSKTTKYKNVKQVSLILYFVMALLLLVLPLYNFSENGVIYTYGPGANISYIIGGLLDVVSVIMIISNIRRVKKIKYLPLIFYIAASVSVILIQKLQPEILLVTAVESFVTFLLYFTIENPDVKLIEQLNLAKEQAERANRAKTEFLSSMSHEIRTPLNAIVGFSNSLSDNKNIPDEAKSDVKDILVASDSLLEIVNGVLDISKIEANKIEIVKKEYDTKKMFDELAKLTKVRIGDKPIDFITKFDETLPRVLYGDQTRTKQVILNILTNAAKYTDKGKIIFSVQSVVKDNVCRMIISVEDTGRGIKKDSINKLFTKFERLDEENNTTIEGTGLGLAITKKLLEMMHGKIVVQSEYGKGSKFTISLDQRIVKNPTIKLDEEKTDDIEIIDLSSKKVLVVDDNKLNIKVATRLLSPYNVEIVSAESGMDSIEILKKDKKIDLVLMDDMMPKMSGTETLKEIKKNNLYDGPIIALTANALTGMREKYIEHGFTDYLSKPIEKPELNRILKTYLTK